MAEKYEIRVRGHVHDRHFAGYEGLAVTHTADGETILVGPMRDQAELHGILCQIRDLALILVSVNPERDPAPTVPDRLSANSLQYFSPPFRHQ